MLFLPLLYQSTQERRSHDVLSIDRSREIMDSRRIILYFLLVALVLHANYNSAAADVCKYRTPMMPFCKGWMCKAECWVEAKLFLATLKEHRCAEGGIKGYCYCLFCGLKNDD